MIALKLRSHFIIYLTLITLVLSLILVYLLTNRLAEQALLGLDEYGQAMTMNSALISADYLLTEDYATLQQFAEDYASRPKVKKVSIADRYGSTIASSDMSRLGQHLAGSRAEWGEGSTCEISRDADGKGQLIVMAPIKMDTVLIGFTKVVICMDAMEASVAASRRQGILVGLVAWCLSVLFGLYVAGSLSKPMQQLTRRANKIKAGDFSSEEEVGQQVRELGEFSQALNVMAKTIGAREKSLREMVANLDILPTPVFSIDAQFLVTYINPAGAAAAHLTPAECLGHKCAELFNTPICNTAHCPMRQAMDSGLVSNGETTIGRNQEIIPVKFTTVAFRDGDGVVTGGLESFIDISELQHAFAQAELENTLRNAQLEISDRLRGEQDEETLCTTLLRELAKHIPFQAGTIYLVGEGHLLNLLASYAGQHNFESRPVFHFGEGITGQAAVEKRPIMLSNIPDDYVPVLSASGSSMPRHIIALPILFEGHVSGVIELATLNEFDGFSLELLDRVLENAAIAINMAQARARVGLLLGQTQQQAEELQSQQEELQASNEELREQTQALQKTETQLQQQAEELQSQQEELQVTNEELAERTQNLELQQNEVSRKNEALATQRNELLHKTEALETSNRYKAEFLANMSHELRTPLNSILILSQLFATNKEGNLNGKQLEFARTINSSGTELLTLINEVLDLSKVEAGHVQLDIVSLDLRDFLDAMEQSFAPVATERNITLVTELLDVPASITTDAQKLLQVVKNLLSNALKFTEKGEVRLRISRPPADMDCGVLAGRDGVAISVMDSGIGIAPEKQDLIFEAFQQVDGSISRRYGGTGLGLSIAKEFAGLLGGEIRLTSEVGHGSCFTVLVPDILAEQSVQEGETTKVVSVAPVVLPAEKKESVLKAGQQAEEDRAEEGQDVADDRKNLADDDKILLIIEDDSAFSEVLADLAHERGFKCVLASDGESGLHYADYYQPGAIILDIGLPGMDGWQVMDSLKKNSKTSHIPVHFMSAADKSQQAREMGAIGYLVKPVSVEKVQETFAMLEDEISRTVKKLLIVEDHRDQRRSMVELISDPHIDISGVATGTEAWKLLKKASFDCMILDLGLQDMEGFKLLEMIRGDEALCNLPVIIYTGRELTPDEDEKLRHYSSSIIIKGVQSPERLLAETTLFLHQVEADLPEDKQRMLAMAHKREDIFAAKKVLVVDDDMRNVFALSSVLEEKGMEVLAAENGKKALDILDKIQGVSVVLMDIMMPEMDGFEAMARIRSQAKFAKLPIIALTAKAMKGDRHKCIEAGANDYLAKPVDVERLVSMLRVWLCQ